MDRATELAREIVERPDFSGSLRIEAVFAAALRRYADERLEAAAKVASAADSYTYPIAGKIIAAVIREMKETQP